MNLANTTSGSSKKRLIQFLKYLVGGGVWFWGGYLVFAICYSGFGWDWLWAKIMADFIGWTLNYLVQRYWAFNSPGLARQNARISERYVAITGLNFVLDYLLIWGLKSVGITPYVGFFVSAGLFTFWNYAWYKFWVFVPKK